MIVILNIFEFSGGFGMNTGLQDAHNIAWKLASVISGNASKSLLSTYQSGKFADLLNTALGLRQRNRGPHLQSF